MASYIARRKFLATLLGGAAASCPLAARAQQPGKLPTIGFLGATTPSAQRQWTDAFVDRLRELGWIEGRNVAIEYRWAEGHPERAAAFVAAFGHLKINVIVTHASNLILAVKQATPVIPIVFAAASEPVGTGIVASLARPGGNVTGLSIQSNDTAGKKLGLLREVVPALRRLAIVANAATLSNVLEMNEVRAAAQMLGVEVAAHEIQRAEEIASAFEAFKGRVEALYMCPDPLFTNNRIRINTLAQGARLPTIYSFREYVEAGGLMSYGPNLPDLFRRAAEFTDKILHGAKPADLPVEQPTKFDLVVNLTTAKALGLELPPTLLARADEVIE